MKNYLLVLVLIVAASVTLYSLDTYGGAKASAELGWLSGSDWVDGINFLDDSGNGQPSKIRFGVSVGGYVGFKLTANLSLQLEMLFSSIGGSYSVTYGGVDMDGKLWANVLQFPVLVRPQTTVGDGILYSLVGASPLLILGDLHTKASSGGVSAESTDTPDNTFNVALIAGAGYAFAAGAGNLELELRFFHSLLDIYDNDNTRLNSIELFIGYAMQIPQ